METAICDANILIDFSKTDVDILPKIAHYFDRVYIPNIILNEVKIISIEKAEEMGFVVEECSLDVVKEKGLSLADSVCLNYVRIKRCDCITNDRKLRSYCVNSGATVIWGLEMVLKLYEKRVITYKQAKKAAQQVKDGNVEITDEVFDSFITKLEGISQNFL